MRGPGCIFMHRYRIKFFSIRYKLFLIFIFCFICPLAIVTVTSYTITSKVVRDKASIANYNLLSHIGDNINYILGDVREISILLLTNKNLTELLKYDSIDASQVLKTRNEAQEALINLVMDNKYIDHIQLVGNNGYQMTLSRFYFEYQVQPEKKHEVVRNIFNDNVWTTNGELGYYLDKNDDLTFVRSIQNIEDVSDNLGLMSINISAKTISGTYYNRMLYKSSDTYVIDNRGMIVSSSKSGDIGKLFSRKLFAGIKSDAGNKYLDFKDNGDDYLLFYSKLDSFSWYVINIVPLDDILNENIALGRIILLSTIICGLISIFIIIIYLKKGLDPLTEISRLMKEVEKENYSISIPYDTNDEVGILSKSFNRMIKKLDELIKQVYFFQIKQRDAQIFLLRNQINPHFLYNTLDIVYWKSKMENALETSEIVKVLSLYFRKSTSNIETVTSVKEELAHAEYYIYIQRIRFGGRIEFEIRADEALQDCKTINFILQPLIENSLNHGIENNGGVGRIEVVVKKSGENLVMEVIDDGAGADIEEIRKLLDESDTGKRGFAIRNINDRIKLLFGESFGLYYEINDECTVARVIQPLLTDDNPPAAGPRE